MERWKLYAFASAFFAGLTSVIAKAGLNALGADLGLAVRTIFVCIFVMMNLWVWTGPTAAAQTLQNPAARSSILLLAFSALTTSLSWICYYRAMKEGTVSYVSLVDKGSIVVTLTLSVIALGEPFTWRIAAGASLIVSGLVVLAGGK
jgi:transporter family protein